MPRPRAALRNGTTSGAPAALRPPAREEMLASTAEVANTPAAQVQLPDSTGPPRLQLPPVAVLEGPPLARVTLTVSEVAAVLGISRTKAYEAVAAGSIPSVK